MLTFEMKSRHICITAEAISECMAVIAEYAEDVHRIAHMPRLAISEDEGRQYFTFIMYMQDLIETPPPCSSWLMTGKLW
jgi:hypothetical protein